MFQAPYLKINISFKELPSDIEITKYSLFLSENIIDSLPIKLYKGQPLKNFFLWSSSRTQQCFLQDLLNHVGAN